MKVHVLYDKDSNTSICRDSEGKIIGTINWRTRIDYPVFEIPNEQSMMLFGSDFFEFDKFLRRGNEKLWALRLPKLNGFVEIHSVASGHVYKLKWQGLFHGQMEVVDSEDNVIIRCSVESSISDFSLEIIDLEAEWNNAAFVMLVAYCKVYRYYGRSAPL